MRLTAGTKNDPMKLFRVIASAQEGRIFANMGHFFGLSDELAAQVVRYFLPPITKTIERKITSQQGLTSVLEFLGSRRYGRLLINPHIFGHPKVREEGQRILGYLFGGPTQVSKIIANRTKVLPLQPEALERIFPYIAVMALGAIEHRTRRPLGEIVHQVSHGAADERALINPYAALAHFIRRREAAGEDGRSKRTRITSRLSMLFARSESQPAA